ncbi:phosphate system positive regulatory protein pho81 [Coemansia biformis]|uniref:Phosphate system positive regulatory protein pho81 n=1 Tax=Coemansia biformis TaxID=1286918 RepID=A0A9W7YF02_9FUNG|nr:phosphate system positive regulatory protein pho81 [Coemansia biformis]
MKFGKHIQAHTIPEWAAHYMNYKALKKIINELSVPLPPRANPSDAAKERLQTVKAAFFFQVDRELEKVNTFYLQKEADFKVRLKSLIEKQRMLGARGPRNHVATTRALHEAFLCSRHDLDKLQNFVEINGTGFRKILKKWDKRSKSSTKELYLARQVEVQPCFNQDVVAELSDTVTKCLSDLEHVLDADTECISPETGPHDLAPVTPPPLREPAAAGAPPRDAEPYTAGDQPAPAARRRSSTGFLLDAGVSRSVQIDRAESELFHALALTTAQPATPTAALVAAPTTAPTAAGLLDKYKVQQTEIQKACVTRVLWRACSEIKDPDKQRALLDSGLADLRSIDDINERTLAHEASIHGALEILQAAVAAGGCADEPDYYNRRPAHYAAINNHERCLEYLLGQGCSVRAIDDDGSDVFDYAVAGGHVGCARLLLEYDSDVVLGSPGHPPVLMLACEKGHEELVRMLLAAGAEVAASAQGLHPLHVAARAGLSSILRMLLDHGAPVDVADKDLGWTPVFYAASEGNIECIRVLLDADCDLAAVDENGRGPSFFAANEGHLGCVDLLLAAGSSRAKRSSTATGDSSTGVQAAPAAEAAKDSAGVSSLDLDGIPSLSLPPPLIPFRVYGHNFLGKRTRIHIHMQSDSRTGASPVQFVDARDMVSLRLVAVAKPDAGMVPHTVMLPMDTPTTTFGFQTDCVDQFRLEFLLYPSFGLQPIGKAVALPSLFAKESSGVARLPLLDRHLKLVADISFEFLVIRPFEGAQLQIGGKVETYWKSTNPGLQQNASASTALAAPLSFGSPPSRPLLSSGISSMAIASPSSIAESAVGGSGYGSVPIVISSSLAAEHVCVQVQVCRDGVPVVSSQMYVDLGEPSGAKLRIHGLTYEEFRRVMNAPAATAAGGGGSRPMPSAETGSAEEWHRYLCDSGLALEKVLEVLPVRFGINIQVLDNSLSWSGTNSNIGSARHDMNAYIDAVLKTIYNDSTKNMRSSNSPQAAADGSAESVAGAQQRKEGGQRNTIFCSYSPTVCVALNWKQPNYAVFLLTTGRESLDQDAGSSARSVARAAGAPSFGPSSNHLSLKEAVRFACTNNLLGIMCSASLLTRVPALIDSIKSNGLVAISFGPENRDDKLCLAQKDHAVDAIMCDGAIKYEPDESLEYAI